MLCQNCHKNEATIHLYTNVNGTRQQIDLCQNCYQLLKKQQGNPTGGQPINAAGTGDPFGFSNLDDIFRAMGQGSMPENNGQSFQQGPQTQAGGNGGNGRGGKNGNGGLLEQFGVNLTNLAKQGKVDPVIGRDKEIERVIEILNRRTKNNPVLIGEAGVGKTAVVEGLAQKIVAGQVPQKLQNKEIIRLDVVSLVQGTGIRGQFEQRMQQLMDEVRKNENVILFIDEIHEIMGAGNAEGGMDAGNVLKPALARGDFQLVGATTSNEYRKIEKDAALERRFQPVHVEEPTVDETVQILKGLQKKYEDYHHVKYTDEAINAAATLSNRYIQDRFLPDKAIDLLDEAGSKKNLTINTVDPKVIKEKMQQAESQKQQALKQEDYEKAAYYRDQVKKLTKMQASDTASEDTPSIGESDMEQIVEEKTNIPVGELHSKEQKQLRTLASDLDKHVIGQTEAVNKVARAIRRNRIGFNKSGRPIGSFLFVGPTGIGKTELAKQLAQELFGSEDSMIRFDMSEYMEKHSVSKLIGSPPGYVGYEEAGQLTEKVRRNPYSLILLDEIEKAHPDVMHMFLQILDDGRLTDAQGRTVSFKDTIIIMTSNAGQGDAEANVGFGAAAAGQTHSIIDQLSNYFKPEFLNRFDDIVEFNSLTKKDLLKIVDLMLADVNQMTADQGLTIHVTEAAKEKLVDLGYNPAMGARPLRRVIQEQIEDQVADYYLDHADEKELEAHLLKDKIVIDSQKPAIQPATDKA
ncbi:ATP-dependent Clp protease ATP-binding subunit [Loigolactobacillus backii]|uniref:ATP-dependent Clp protease ATP-binding subunit n=1 Tax=Loigolactobacillus backii TaxID=375175 RepID=A0A192H620_9LACO|nr:ATP-dependent Clp protease ATP-binding subunit [Loigolactobacillus backii]ANK60088.1 ATP-dependent Clp protease ATP-binding subunit [Loigolactobacillus backii]ANK63436.1 ATP-dependent Clp protease ATP-binding subunit [Loigolactobacillus backii]ANK64970.1 ATP-dependent Clp protease ATP-binding subunit [Loigolactobacillus backii]ANK66529.1 ATP-dependent Clp protease ATP-binding subunit [Loigolactobacillus backii]ANK69559.1 ATP-dependent Clp protease ATP-binding subunit [Loigolactobacillus bac